MGGLYVLPREGTARPMVSWDGSGDFDGTYDDLRDDLARGTPIIIEIGRDQGRALSRGRLNLSTWTLKNQHRRYSKENSGSPLRGQLKPGRPCIIEETIGTDVLMGDPTATMGDPEALMGGNTPVRLFTGQTDLPKERYGPGPRKRWVQMRAIGALTKLRGSAPITIGYHASITTGAAMVLVWEAAGLTAAQMVVDQDAIDNGRLLLHWYVDARDPWTVSEEIWATEGPTGALYEDQEGRANFEGANFLALTDRCQTIQQTFTTSDDTRESALMGDPDATMGDPRVAMDGSRQSLTFIGLDVEDGYRQIVNDVTFRVEQRAQQSTQQVWEYNGSLSLSAAEVRTIIATTDDPLAAITTPVLTTDYTVTGTALASVTATQLGAKSVAITFTAGAGSATVGPYSGGNGPRLRGQPVTLIGTIDAVPTIDVTDSQDEYGRRPLPSGISIWPCLEPAAAAGLADAWVQTYSVERPQINVTIVNKTGRLLYQQVRRRISDLIHVVDPTESGVDLDLTIHSIRHEIHGDWLQYTTFGCEKRVEQDWGQWDVARFDVDVFGQ